MGLNGERVSFAELPAHVDEDTSKNIETFWNLVMEFVR